MNEKKTKKHKLAFILTLSKYVYYQPIYTLISTKSVWYAQQLELAWTWLPS